MATTHMLLILPSWFLIEISLQTVELRLREHTTSAIGTTLLMETLSLERHSSLLAGVSPVRSEQSMTILTRTVA